MLALATFALDMISFFTVYGLLVSFSNEELDDKKSDADKLTQEAATSFAEETGEVVEDVGSLDSHISNLEELHLTQASAHLGRILVIMVYTICDIVFILWILHFRSRMGGPEREYLLKALLGFGDGMRVAFGAAPKGDMGKALGSSGKNQAIQKNRGGKPQRRE